MTIDEYLMKAVQDDARRAGERDRLLLEARRARRARRQRLVPAAPARRRTEMGKIVVSENVTLDGVIQDPAGDGSDRPGRDQHYLADPARPHGGGRVRGIELGVSASWTCRFPDRGRSTPSWGASSPAAKASCWVRARYRAQ